MLAALEVVESDDTETWLLKESLDLLRKKNLLRGERENELKKCKVDVKYQRDIEKTARIGHMCWVEVGVAEGGSGREREEVCTPCDRRGRGYKRVIGQLLRVMN